MTASDAYENNYFGFSVSISDNYALIGAFGNSSSAGAAYAFLHEGDTWNESKKITDNEGSATYNYFGNNVSISEDFAIVGARNDDNGNGNDAGAAYIYHTIDDLSLPIELSSFTASIGNGSVILNWTTESEINNLGFILERSEGNDNYFEELASYAHYPELKGQGNSSQQTAYSFIDRLVRNGITYYYRLSDVNFNGNRIYHGTVSATPNESGIDIEREEPVLSRFYLYPNYPNPFNPETTIKFEVPLQSNALKEIRLTIYNSLGEKVRELLTGELAGGIYEIKWDGTDNAGIQQPSGVYFLYFQSEYLTQKRKMVLIQ